MIKGWEKATVQPADIVKIKADGFKERKGKDDTVCPSLQADPIPLGCRHQGSVYSHQSSNSKFLTPEQANYDKYQDIKWEFIC